jgi:hypothetical protein
MLQELEDSEYNSDTNQESPPTKRVMRSSSTSAKMAAGIKYKKRKRSKEKEEESDEAAQTAKKPKTTSSDSKSSKSSSSAPPRKSASKDLSQQPQCHPCPLTNMEDILTVDQIWISDCVCFSRLHLANATDKELKKLIKQLKGTCEAEYKKLDGPFKAWTKALRKPRATPSDTKKVPMHKITGTPTNIFAPSSASRESPSSPSCSSRASSSVRYLTPGSNDSKKCHFVRPITLLIPLWYPILTAH